MTPREVIAAVVLGVVFGAIGVFVRRRRRR
jgi:LPXTG-motif cell wall-anchored protein